MHIVVLFHNIGGYHAARLRAAHAVCIDKGWRFTAVQETDSAQEHPWGDLEKEITFSLETLLPAQDVLEDGDRDPQSKVAAYRLPACLDVLRPDVLFIPGWGYPVSRAASKWAKRHRCSTVVMSESKWNDTHRRWWKEKIKSLLYVSQFNSALVGGRLHRDYLMQLNFPKDGIFLGYDVVDNDYFTQRSQQARKDSEFIRKQNPNIPSRPYFIAVTRFIPRKNILRLVDAFASYKAACSPEGAWDLVICGSGAEEANVRSRIAHHCIENSVHLPGFKSYQEIPDWFGLASAFVHPALSEQWGLVVNEALASGLPALVSNRCGCFLELIIEAKNGFGFNPENTHQLTELMLEISQGSIDLDVMSQAALDHIQSFSPQDFGRGFAQAIQFALSP